MERPRERPRERYDIGAGAGEIKDMWGWVP